MRGFFVTGTDTGVGKTVLAAALASRPGYRYWKPIQTGPDDDTAEVQRLGARDVFDRGVRLPDPVSPHLAAHRAGVRIDIAELLAFVGRTSRSAAGLPTGSPLPAQADPEVARGPGGPPHTEPAWIVEGAGGVLVPVNESETMADLMVSLKLPVIVAARTALGTINHTLLTLALLRTCGLETEAVVLIGDPQPGTREAVEHYGHTRTIEMPRFDPLTPEHLQHWTETYAAELPRAAESKG